MQLHFHTNPTLFKQLPEEDFEAIERAQDGEVRLYRLRPLIARFMVDDQNQPLTHEAAMKQLGRIPTGEWDEVIRQFADAFRDAAVPNTNGSLSKSPSDPTSTAPPSPTGAQQ